MKSLRGKLTFQDLGPGKYELVHPTVTYNLALNPALREQIDLIFATNTGAEFIVRGQVLTDIATIGGTNKQTLLVESFELP